MHIEIDKLEALAQQWERVARNKFRTAPMEETEFGRRFIEHGAICYYNCLTELRALIGEARYAARDLNAQVVQQDAEGP